MSRHNYRNDRDDDRDHDNGQEGYKFSISGSTVNAVYEFEHGRLKLERMDADESWAFDGSTVTKTEYEHGRLEITTYADLDGDGIFTKIGKSYGAATTTTPTYTVPTYDIYNDADDVYGGTSASGVDADDVYTGTIATGVISGASTPVLTGADADDLLATTTTALTDSDADDIYAGTTVTADVDAALTTGATTSTGTDADDLLATTTLSSVVTAPTVVDSTLSTVAVPSSYSSSYSAYTAPSISYHFDVLNGEVVGATRAVNGYERDVRLGWNESWELRGDDVAQVQTKWNEIETKLYTDDNFDGAYDRALEIEVKTQATARHYEDNRFVLEDGTLADGANLFADDVIASQLEANRWGWKTERLDLNEDLSVTEIDGSVYIMKTETKRSGELEFKLFRDDDADGLWTEVAEGDASAPFLDDMGALDVLRLEDTGLLADSYGIIA